MINEFTNRSIISRINILWVLFILMSCSNSNDHLEDVSSKGNNQVKQRLVDIEVAKKDDFPVELIVNGKIESMHKTTINIDQKDYITELNIFNGKLVQKGDTLAVIENSHQKIHLQKAKLGLKKAENELSSLMLGFGGTADDTNSVDKEIFKNLKVNSGFTKALLDLELAKLNYQNTFINAPFSGIIANLEYQIYQYAKSGTPLCQLVNNDDYSVEFKVTEKELSKISIGQSIKLQTIYNGKANCTGRIMEINPMVDDNALIMVKAKINNSHQTLINGMNAVISIEKKIPNSLSIPKKAMVLRNNRKVVFTIKHGKAFWNYVETSAENSKRFLVTEGLKEGDSVIIEGNINLAHQVDIIIKE